MEAGENDNLSLNPQQIAMPGGKKNEKDHAEKGLSWRDIKTSVFPREAPTVRVVTGGALQLAPGKTQTRMGGGCKMLTEKEVQESGPRFSAGLISPRGKECKK